MLYDLLIIGGGPAGYHAAVLAGKRGLSVALFEPDALGGTCLNSGCIPTKTLLYSAKLYDQASGGSVRYGLESSATIDPEAVLKRKERIVKTLASGIAASLKNSGVTVINAAARVIAAAPGNIAVEAAGERLSGKALFVASGSRAIIPPVPGIEAALDSGFAVTSAELLKRGGIPEKLLVMGGGVIGLEMASYFNSTGSKVTVVEMLDRIGGAFDAELAGILQKEYAKKGVKFLLSSKVCGFSGKSVTVEDASGRHVVECDAVLVAVGRKPNGDGLGLAECGVRIERGAVAADANMRTGVPDIYAIGDVNGKIMLAHAAYRQAEIALNTLSGVKDAFDEKVIPAVIYTNPELASVGETAATAAAAGIVFREDRIPLRLSGRYLAENEGGNGVAKVLFDSDGRLIGASILGNPASEIIPFLTLAVQSKLTRAELAKVVLPHPTVAEAFHSAFIE